MLPPRRPWHIENRQLETKDMLRDERTALLAHDAACTVILQALTNGRHEIESIIALWRRKSVEQIALALSALQLGSEHDHDILEHFTQQELEGLMSAGPAAFASQQNVAMRFAKKGQARRPRSRRAWKSSALCRKSIRKSSSDVFLLVLIS